jgi:hypothetical protein
MELNETLDMGTNANNATVAASLSSEMRDYLGLAAYWAKFLGIVSYVACAFIAIIAVMAIFGMGFVATLAEASSVMPAMGGMLIFVGLLYLGLAYLMFYIARAMHQFGVKTEYALAQNDDEYLTIALKNLKSLFRTQGIFTAIFVGFYVVIFVLMLLIGGTAFLTR